MIVNDNNTGSINTALLDIQRRMKNISGSQSDYLTSNDTSILGLKNTTDALQSDIDDINATLSTSGDIDNILFGHYRQIPVGTNLNDLGYGIWNALDNTSYTNGPQANFTLICGRLMGCYEYQIAIAYPTGTIWTRTTYYNGGSVAWTSWGSH